MQEPIASAASGLGTPTSKTIANSSNQRIITVEVHFSKWSWVLRKVAIKLYYQMYISGQKCFFALLIFCIRQVWSPQHAKDSKVTSPIPRKPATPNVLRTAATSTQSNGAPPRMAPFPLPARPLSFSDRFGRGVE